MRRLKAPFRAVDAIGGVDDAEINLRLRPYQQMAQWREIPIIGIPDRYRQVDPVNGAPDGAEDAVGQIHQPVHVGGQRKFVMDEVVEAKMQTELHPVGHPFA